MSAKSRPAPFPAPAALLGLRLLAAGAALAAATGRAEAGCTPGAGGPRDFTCTGAIGARTFTNARTVALTGATASGSIAVTPTTGGNIGFSMDSRSSISAASGNGLTLITSKGAIDTNTPTGSGINGAITATSGVAIFAKTSGAGGNIDITTGAGGVLNGSAGGIVAITTGGAVNLDLNGAITSANGIGVAASTVDGAINITANADISGGAGGIVASASGKGLIAIKASGNISATTGPAVQAIAGGTGNVTAYLTGAISGKIGVLAGSGSGDVTLTTTGTVTANDGIIAATGGAGSMTTTTGGLVTALTGNGVATQSVDGENKLYVGSGGVKAANNGVVAAATGTGDVLIQAHGDISGKTGYGVAAVTKSGSIQIDLDSGTFVSGGKAGVAIVTKSGDAVLNTAASISGGAKGAGVVADLGAGSLTLNNTGTITGVGAGAIEIVSGAALVKNSGTIDGQILSTGLTTVNNNGNWNNAAGSIIQYLNNNGVLSLGPDSGKVGVIGVTGDASFGKDSYYNARLTSTSSDAIYVAGQTTINGGVVKISGADTKYQRGTRYLLLYSKDGVTGQFDRLMTDISAYTGVLSYDPNDVYVTILARDFRALALTRNQWAVANSVYLGTFSMMAGPGANLLTAINNVPDSAIPGVLTQLSGDGVVTGASNAAMQAGHLFTSVLDDQQSLWRSGGLRDINGVTLRDNIYAPVYTDGSKWPASRQQVAPPVVATNRTWRAWGAGFGGQQSMVGDTVAGSASQSMTSFGGAVGVDYQVGSSMLLGVGIGYSANSFSSATGVQGNSNGLHIGGYAGYRVGAFYASSSLAYSGFDNKAKRTITPFGGASGEVENSSFASEELRHRTEIGMGMAYDAMAITPFTAIEIASLHNKPFMETSTAAGGQSGLFVLSYAGQGATSVPTFLGVRAESRIDFGGGMAFAPSVSVAWRHEWAGSRTQTATLVALPTASFVAIGARPLANSLQLKASATLEITRTAAVFASFEGEFLNKNPVYAGKGGVRVGW